MTGGCHILLCPSEPRLGQSRKEPTCLSGLRTTHHTLVAHLRRCAIIAMLGGPPLRQPRPRRPRAVPACEAAYTLPPRGPVRAAAPLRKAWRLSAARGAARQAARTPPSPASENALRLGQSVKEPTCLCGLRTGRRQRKGVRREWRGDKAFAVLSAHHEVVEPAPQGRQHVAQGVSPGEGRARQVKPRHRGGRSLRDGGLPPPSPVSYGPDGAVLEWRRDPTAYAPIGYAQGRRGLHSSARKRAGQAPSPRHSPMRLWPSGEAD